MAFSVIEWVPSDPRRVVNLDLCLDYPRTRITRIASLAVERHMYVVGALRVDVRENACWCK